MQLSKTQYRKARDFILTNARMIERRLFHYHFEQGDANGVFHAVYAYRNLDGGFGHGMEPDTASPESQPLFTLMALESLEEAGLLNKDLLLQDFMPYIESITTAKGGIPWMFRPKGDYPCEEHFTTVKEWAALSTTAPFLGLLEKYKIHHPWMEKAEAFVWEEIDRIKEKHLFCHLCTPRRLTFLQHTKSRVKATKALADLKHWILAEGVLCLDPKEEGWGLYGKPHSLMYAPATDSLLSPIFSPVQIEKDLNALVTKQEEDGRWDTWYGISEGMKLEWAGIQTLWTLKVLKNYGRIDL
jgi:hypothetical protein